MWNIGLLFLKTARLRKAFTSLHFTKRIFRDTILVTLLSSEKGCRKPLRRMCGFSRTSSHIWGMRGYVAKGRLYSKLRKVFSWVRFSRELRALVVVYYRCFPPKPQQQPCDLYHPCRQHVFVVHCGKYGKRQSSNSCIHHLRIWK